MLTLNKLYQTKRSFHSTIHVRFESKTKICELKLRSLSYLTCLSQNQILKNPPKNDEDVNPRVDHDPDLVIEMLPKCLSTHTMISMLLKSRNSMI